ILGSAYFVGGAIGFIATGGSPVTGISHDLLFGFFPLNVYHNIVHLVIGALWFLGAFALTAAGNEGLNIAIGGIYVLATVLGFLGYLPLLSIHAGNDADNYLHLVTAVLTLVFGTGVLRAFRSRQVPAMA
ncbi:MAG: DUF4383 domain-containing protein, partial [Pseudonocardiaceae bacterium]